jgi:hypothetical protein
MDAGLKEVKELTQLARLYLSDTQVTDTGVKELKELKKLTTLNLRVLRDVLKVEPENGEARCHLEMLRTLGAIQERPRRPFAINELIGDRTPPRRR